MLDKPISPLRQRMIHDVTARRYPEALLLHAELDRLDRVDSLYGNRKPSAGHGWRRAFVLVAGARNLRELTLNCPI